jgi:V/A-type H+-transporting ATPase subunit E
MGLEDILKKISQKNKKDIEHIKKEASKKCDETRKETKSEIQKLKENSRNEAKTSATSLKEHMLQEARLKIAKGILKTKSDILDEIFKEALQKLENLSNKEYFTWMEKMILKVVEAGENEIILPKEVAKKQNIEEFLKKLNKRLQTKSRIKLSKEKKNIGGGFILKRPRKEINCTFKSLLEEKLNSLRIKVGQLLF